MKDEKGALHDGRTLQMTSRRDILLPLLWLAFCSSFCGFFLANVALAKAGVNRTASFIGVWIANRV